jgi:hypothetical protein
MVKKIDNEKIIVENFTVRIVFERQK